MPRKYRFRILIAGILVLSLFIYSQFGGISQKKSFNKLDYIRLRDFIRYDCQQIERIGKRVVYFRLHELSTIHKLDLYF